MRRLSILIVSFIISCNQRNNFEYDTTLKCDSNSIKNFNFKVGDSIVLKYNLPIFLKKIDSINNQILKTKYPKLYQAGFIILPLNYFTYYEENIREIEVSYFLSSNTKSNNVYLIDTNLQGIIYGVRVDLLKNKVVKMYIVGHKGHFMLEDESLVEAYNRITPC